MSYFSAIYLSCHQQLNIPSTMVNVTELRSHPHFIALRKKYLPLYSWNTERDKTMSKVMASSGYSLNVSFYQTSHIVGRQQGHLK